MSLLINKDGKQLGPYTLEEARALVLAGKLDTGDWAWPDGGNDWIPLRDVPGFTTTTSVPPPPANPPAATSEKELWRGHPAQILNFNIYLFWFVVLVVTLVVAILFADTQSWVFILLAMVAVPALVQITLAWLHLRAIEYVVTNQRVQIISGIFSKDIQEIELFRVKDTMAHQSFFLRLFGLGTITILSGDKSQPRLTLSGVPRAIELREQLREEVMILRQRFGVRELDVM